MKSVVPLLTEIEKEASCKKWKESVTRELKMLGTFPFSFFIFYVVLDWSLLFSCNLFDWYRTVKRRGRGCEGYYPHFFCCGTVLAGKHHTVNGVHGSFHPSTASPCFFTIVFVFSFCVCTYTPMAAGSICTVGHASVYMHLLVPVLIVKWCFFFYMPSRHIPASGISI